MLFIALPGIINPVSPARLSKIRSLVLNSSSSFLFFLFCFVFYAVCKKTSPVILVLSVQCSKDLNAPHRPCQTKTNRFVPPSRQRQVTLPEVPPIATHFRGGSDSAARVKQMQFCSTGSYLTTSKYYVRFFKKILQNKNMPNERVLEALIF